MALTIRKAVEKDQQVMYQFVCYLDEKHYDPTSFSERLVKHLSEENYRHFIIEDEKQRPIGLFNCIQFSSLHDEVSTVDIQEFFLIREFRKPEFFTEVIEAVEKYLDQQIHWSVAIDSSDSSMKKIYEKLGFVASGVLLKKEK